MRYGFGKTMGKVDLVINVVTTGLMTHILMIFYAKTFQWSHLSWTELWQVDNKFWRQYSRCDSPTSLKAILCFVVTGSCLNSAVSANTGALMTVLLALPQLYRIKGRFHQEMRVVLGPLTPILAANNVCMAGSLLTILAMLVSCAAFVILRPDNTAVLDVFLKESWFAEQEATPSNSDYKATWPLRFFRYFQSRKHRRKWHGILAASNATLALSSILLANHLKIQKITLALFGVVHQCAKWEL
jgi:hypothetical protein